MKDNATNFDERDRAGSAGVPPAEGWGEGERQTEFASKQSLT
jgi:hypothetical protein